MTIGRAVVALAVLVAAGTAALSAQADLRGIGGSGPNNIWVVGDRPVAVHFDGQSWTEVPFGMAPGGTLNAVWVGGPRDVWAVGSSGTIIHYDGTAWTRVSAPTDRELVAVEGRSANDIYALAQSYSDRDPPILLRYDGHAWTAAPLQLPFRAGSMAVTPTEVVVAGFVYRDPTPQQRRQVGVVARLRAGSWTISGFNGQSVTDPIAGGAGWTSISAGGNALLLFGTRDDGTAAIALSSGGGAWQMLPPAVSAMASTQVQHALLVGDATPVVLYSGPGFARYTGGAWAAVAPAANMMQQMMQMQMMGAQQPTNPQQAQQQQQQQQQMAQMMANPMMMGLQMAAFDMSNARSAWGSSANDFYVVLNDGRISHVTGGSAAFVYDASCGDPMTAGMNPICQMMQQQRQQGPPR